jgi:hypothetical protein
LLYFGAFLLAVSAYLLAISAFLLAVSALAERLELLRHVLDGPGQVSQLARDGRNVVSGSQLGRILRTGANLIQGAYAASGIARRWTERLRKPSQHAEVGVKRDPLDAAKTERYEAVFVLQT